MAYEAKTKPTKVRVSDFLASVDNPKRVADCKAVMAIMRRLTGKRAAMWGPSIIGFGRYQYTYESGHSGEMCLTGLSPRKANLVVYLMSGFERYPSLMKKLGKFKTGKSCLYITRLENIDLTVLEKLLEKDIAYMHKTYKTS